MPRHLKAILCMSDVVVLQFWILVLSMILGTPLQVFAQDCTSYYQCANLRRTSTTILRGNGNITYGFDNASLEALIPDAQARDDFKARIIAAANDWSSKTGISITQSSQTPNIRIAVSNSEDVHRSKGIGYSDANSDPYYADRAIEFSDTFPTWSSDGKDFIASHELGHILGLADLTGGCDGAESVERTVS
ncbi:MAG: hypothetical protein ABR577_06920 [Pyrinomonadaceae bacterium]